MKVIIIIRMEQEKKKGNLCVLAAPSKLHSTSHHSPAFPSRF